MFRFFHFMLICTILTLPSLAQEIQNRDTADINDVIGKILKKSPKSEGKKSGMALLPAIGYNPSMGFILGANITASMYAGDPETTRLSTGTATVFFTTKGIINLQFRHNLFTSGDDWIFQGNFQASKMIVIDYGLGNSAVGKSKEGISVMGYPLYNPGTSFPIKFGLFRLNEKVYRQVTKSLFIGGGINIDYHRNIIDEKLQTDSGIVYPALPVQSPERD